MVDKNQERLFELASEALLEGDHTLSSGKKSPYYFDGRKVTLSSEGVALVGEMFWKSIAKFQLDAIGGPIFGAVPIVLATVLTARFNGAQLDGFAVRQEKKEHGTQKRIEGAIPRESRVAIVDDTATTGDSLLETIEVAENAGYRILCVIVLLDWGCGASQKIRDRGYNLQSFLEGNLEIGEISIAPNRSH